MSRFNRKQSYFYSRAWLWIYHPCFPRIFALEKIKLIRSHIWRIYSHVLGINTIWLGVSMILNSLRSLNYNIEMQWYRWFWIHWKVWIATLRWSEQSCQYAITFCKSWLIVACDALWHQTSRSKLDQVMVWRLLGASHRNQYWLIVI